MSLLLAGVAWFCSCWALLAGLVWGLALKCDDACSPSRGWRGDEDAWQWYGVAGLGIFAFVAGAAFFVLVLLRRPLLATGVMVAGFAAVAILTRVFTSEAIEHLDRRSPGELLLIAAGIFAPIFAVLLTPRKLDWSSAGR